MADGASLRFNSPWAPKRRHKKKVFEPQKKTVVAVVDAHYPTTLVSISSDLLQMCFFWELWFESGRRGGKIKFGLFAVARAESKQYVLANGASCRMH